MNHNFAIGSQTDFRHDKQLQRIRHVGLPVIYLHIGIGNLRAPVKIFTVIADPPDRRGGAAGHGTAQILLPEHKRIRPLRRIHAAVNLRRTGEIRNRDFARRLLPCPARADFIAEPGQNPSRLHSEGTALRRRSCPRTICPNAERT